MGSGAPLPKMAADARHPAKILLELRLFEQGDRREWRSHQVHQHDDNSPTKLEWWIKVYPSKLELL